jgi:hypothetical protein
MPEYEVRIFAIRSHYYSVKAESKSAAYEEASRRWHEGDSGYTPRDDHRIHDHEVGEADA